MKVPAWFWAFARWRDGGKRGRRPRGVPRLIPMWAWVRYLRHHGRRPAPAPKPLPSPAPIRPEMSGRMVWVNVPTNFPSSVAVDRLRQAGASWLILPLLNGTAQEPWNIAAENAGHLAGVRVAGWGWARGDDPHGEGYRAAIDCAGLQLDGYALNAEKAYDATMPDGSWSAEKYARSQQWADGWLAGWREESRAPIPLMVSTEPRTAMRHEVWQALGAAYAPQAYPLENRATVTDVALFGESVGWKPWQITPLFQAYASGGALPDPEDAATRARQLGLGGLCLYPGDDAISRDAPWDALSHFAAA